MTHFQVPDDRSLNDSVNGLKPWPATPDGYRLFAGGSSGDERIGIHIGQTVELQLTGGKDCRIETVQGQTARATAAGMGGDPVDFEYAMKPPVSPSVAVATSDKQKFTLTGYYAGATFLFATDAAGNRKATLQVVVGKFETHPGMLIDLIAEVCKGSDSLKIHALQRLLRYNDASDNSDNIFAQHTPSNDHPVYHDMQCGIVAKSRGAQVFGKIAEVGHDWYKAALHEPLTKTFTKRTDLKYKPEKIADLTTQIRKALRHGKAVRVGVVDAVQPSSVMNGKFVAYGWGGHTTIIVGCNDTLTEFLYIDPWEGSSKMEYKGGISGNKFPGKCWQLGLFVLKQDADRRVKSTDTGPNLLRGSQLTEGSMGEANGRFLEVVSAPFVFPGR